MANHFGELQNLENLNQPQAYGNLEKTPVDSQMESNNSLLDDLELIQKLDSHSLESIVDLKISRFLDQIGTFYPEELHNLMMKKVEKPLIAQILKRTGGNQVHAAKILGINRNTLRKKMKIYGFVS